MTDDSKIPETIRRRVFEVLERGRRRDLASRAFEAVMVLVIFVNVTAAILDTVPNIVDSYGRQLLALDRACVLIFIVEYSARLWTAPEQPMFRHLPKRHARMRFAATPMMIIDLIGILPVFLELMFPAEMGLRLLRLVRFLKIARYSPALGTIGRVIAGVRRPLFACVVLFAGLVIAAAAVMYTLEGHVQPDRLGDMPSAMWWAVVFLTKFGQADVLPHTMLGKLFAVLFMLLGIGFIALPVGIIGRGFYDEIRRRDFVVTFGMVARVPLFSALDASTIAQLVGLLKARKVAAGTIIMHKGDEADGMYFIADGDVEISVYAGNTKRLVEGDFFGEMALLSRGRRTATVTARRPTDLLVLDADDFDRLMEQNPTLANTVHKIAEARKIEGGASLRLEQRDTRSTLDSE
jgi:voltage-gated potassium channel